MKGYAISDVVSVFGTTEMNKIVISKNYKSFQFCFTPVFPPHPIHIHFLQPPHSKHASLFLERDTNLYLLPTIYIVLYYILSLTYLI